MNDDICISGHVIGPQKSDKLMSWQTVGECDGCCIGPLHGTDNDCDCSVRREKMRLCRKCAIAFDLQGKGWSPLLTHAENASIKLARTLADPNRVIEYEGEHVYQFQIRVASYGRASTTKNFVVRELMRSLNNAFKESVTVVDQATHHTIPFDPKAHSLTGTGQSNGNGNTHG